MYHQQFSHTSHSALTLDYECITNNSATLHIQHLHWIVHVSPTKFSHASHSALTHWIMNVSPTIQPHFKFSTYTGLCMYHQQNSATLHIQH